MSNKPLSNVKHEQFCQLVAAGMPVEDAYSKVGYVANPANGRKLRIKASVKARLEWLLASAANRTMNAAARSFDRMSYTREDAMRECEVAMELAKETKNSTGYIAAVTLRSKLSALLIERKEVGGPGDFEGMTDDELWHAVREASGSKDTGTRGKSRTGIEAASDQEGMPDSSRIH